MLGALALRSHEPISRSTRCTRRPASGRRLPPSPRHTNQHARTQRSRKLAHQGGLVVQAEGVRGVAREELEHSCANTTMGRQNKDRENGPRDCNALPTAPHTACPDWPSAPSRPHSEHEATTLPTSSLRKSPRSTHAAVAACHPIYYARQLKLRSACSRATLPTVPVLSIPEKCVCAANSGKKHQSFFFPFSGPACFLFGPRFLLFSVVS